MREECRNTRFKGQVASHRSLGWQCCPLLHWGCRQDTMRSNRAGALEFKEWCAVSKHLNSMWWVEFPRDQGPLLAARII